MRTLNENIADSGGLKTAYLAYKNWEKEHPSEPLLQGLNYTQSQLFWISFAQLWCMKSTPEKFKRLIIADYHGPSKFRILGSLRNQPEFARDFQCAQGTRMNPETKCSVW